MKGRIYDPLAGQFLSADPVMQAPHWSQGMNRYAYVFNDPVNATDPSGFISLPSAVTGGAVAAGHLGASGLAAHGFGLSVAAGLGAAGGVGLGSGGISALVGVPGMFTGTPGYSGTVTDAASVAPTAGSATQPGMADAVGQNRGLQEGATLGQGRTYRLAQCNTSGNPACGISRRFGSDPMDRVVEDFLNARSPDPAFTTVGDSILDLSAPEHAAPIIRDASGRMRLGTISSSGTDQTQVRVNYAALPKGERYVGTIHSHPGASPGLSVGHSEDIDVPSMRELSARMGVRAFRSHVVAAGNGPFYAVHTFEVLPSPGKFILLAP